MWWQTRQAVPAHLTGRAMLQSWNLNGEFEVHDFYLLTRQRAHGLSKSLDHLQCEDVVFSFHITKSTNIPSLKQLSHSKQGERGINREASTISILPLLKSPFSSYSSEKDLAALNPFSHLTPSVAITTYSCLQLTCHSSSLWWKRNKRNFYEDNGFLKTWKKITSPKIWEEHSMLVPLIFHGSIIFQVIF